MNRSNFKESTSYKDRRLVFFKVISIHSNQIPVVVEPTDQRKMYFPTLKLILKPRMRILLISMLIRHKLRLSTSEGIFLFCNNINLPANAFLENIYAKFRDDDGFLYITVSNIDCYGKSLSDTI